MKRIANDEAGWPLQSLAQLDSLQPALWPTATVPSHDLEALRRVCAQHWG